MTLTSLPASPAPPDIPSGTLNASAMPASTPSARPSTPIMSALYAAPAHTFPTESVSSETPSVPPTTLTDPATPAPPEIS
jgi:hypothetical protein